MKKIILNLILLFSLTTFANYDPIINIPDSNFKARLLQASPTVSIASTQTPNEFGGVTQFHKIDTNNDGEIQMSEALVIKWLKVNGSSILSLEGILSFANLVVLRCYSNQLQSLNVQGLTSLQKLECYNNQLTTLNVQGLTNLQTLDCRNNQLQSLNVQYLTSLQSFVCYYNQLSNINLQGLTQLLYISCFGNQITSLNVQGCNNLQTLHCNSNQLTSLNVQDLHNLQTLLCNSNQLTSLNVQGCNNLQTLHCNSNQLTSLNVQGYNNLQTLHCNSNQLTSLNVQDLPNLQTLLCYSNQLTSLNAIGCNNLQTLYCYSNQLTSLNVQGCNNLFDLNCSDNLLLSLDVQDCNNLSNLNCSNNLLLSLDVQDCNNLWDLNCSNNQLNIIFIKNVINQFNIDYDTLNFSDNPNLQYICCSDSQLSQVIEKVTQYNYTNCQVNTYCSFTPGGNYNTITGQFKFDFDNNGCDINDYPVTNAKLYSLSFTGSTSIYTNNQGQYDGYLLQGNHTITPQIENPSIFNITPPTANISFLNNNNNIQTQNFCITPNGNQNDVEVIFTHLNPARPGFDADYKIVYRNIGNQVANGEVSLTYMNDRIDLISSSLSPTNQTTNQLIWSYNNLLPFETRTINLTFNINSPTETPPINNGDILNFEANITPVSTDINPLNNNFVFNQTVVGSYDPNDKTCLQGNTPGPEFIGKYVHYLIRFENTGTFFAENVVVRDDIDLSKFDINSLVVLDASHSMLNTRILNGNRVEFIFEGIQLPFPPSEERHGYVLFKIKTKYNLTVGDSFTNKANIYFDYNWPIITNDEVSTITLLGQPSFEFSEFVSLYPNPANDVINLSAKTGINLQSIEIYNTMGQLLMALPNDSNERSIDVSHLNSGAYFISVNTDKGKGHTKFIKK